METAWSWWRSRKKQFVKLYFYELFVFLVSFANWKLSLYFCCILAKILSITSVTVIKAPTRV